MANSNTKVVPNAKEALNKMKYEVANDVGVKKIFYFLTAFRLFFFFFLYILLMVQLSILSLLPL